MATQAMQPGSLRVWLLAARPATLAAAFVPVAVGCACAAAVSGFRLGPALATLFAAVLIQIGTNFANDVLDHEKGADTDQRVGPIRATQAKLLTPRQMWWGTILVFVGAAVIGTYLAILGGWPIVVIGVLSILCGIAYTGGPFPLGYNGLGDLFVLVFFGFVAVCGTAYVQIGAVPEIAWWAAVPVGALAAAILAVNNLRDRRTDVLVGKRTLAVRLGPRVARAQYTLLIAASYCIPLLLALLTTSSGWVLLPWLTLPAAIYLIKGIYGPEQGPKLNRILVHTAQLLLIHGILFAAGLALSR